ARRFERKSGKLTLRRRLRDAYAMPTHSVHSRTLRKRLYQSRRLKVVWIARYFFAPCPTKGKGYG
ncbi:hypothetical protein, partial [uncultured Bacteroides sp.]|uniref:hypothetical protein n=1 Tax=uncultured Bacteroides sp. TaxID=162156 RepID=UPI00272C53F5